MQITLNSSKSGCLKLSACLARLIQSAVAAEFGGEAGHAQNDNERADSSRDDGDNRAEEICNETGFKGAQLVGSADEKRVQCRDTAAHIVRSEDLNERRAN